MKMIKKAVAALLSTAVVTSIFATQVFAASPQLTNASVSSLVSGKNVIKVNNYSNKFVTNSSTVRVSFQLQDPNGAVQSGKVKFFGENAIADATINPGSSPNQYYIDWTIPDWDINIRNCRLVIYCTDYATGLEDRVEQTIDLKYSKDSVIAEPVNTYVNDFTGGNFYVQTTIYDLTFSGLTDTSFDFCKVGVPISQKNYANISSLGNNTYSCNAMLSTDYWSNSAGEYRISMSADTNNPSNYVTMACMRSIYLNTPNVAPSLYQNLNFTGNKAYVESGFWGWRTGNYISADLQARNININDISSIIVPAGFQITVYDSDYFMGANHTFTQGSYNLSNYGWDNRIESIKVVKI